MIEVASGVRAQIPEVSMMVFTKEQAIFAGRPQLKDRVELFSP
jgi:hypothetical protein